MQQSGFSSRERKKHENLKLSKVAVTESPCQPINRIAEEGVSGEGERFPLCYAVQLSTLGEFSRLGFQLTFAPSARSAFSAWTRAGTPAHVCATSYGGVRLALLQRRGGHPASSACHAEHVVCLSGH